jgi:phosphatidylglycerophosphate synthase
MEEKFAGDKKVGFGLLTFLDNFLQKKLILFVPKFIETYHLTLLTIVWSMFILIGGYLTKYDILWLILVCVMIFFQYITDLLDGAIGRARNTGLIKWGFYMDHLLDYFFLTSILISYVFLFPKEFYVWLFFVGAIFIGFMINSYLSFSTLNQFKIHYLFIGPTEVRFIFIGVNVLLMFFGKTYLAFLLPYLLIFSFIGLIFVIYNTQKKIWEIDEKVKGRKI